MPVTADRRPDRYLIIAGALALAVLLPVSVLLSAWRGDESETWRHLVDTVLWRLLGHTAWLVIGVGIGVLLLGVSLAWLVATQDFPGRRVLDWALLLPLAMPSYVLAFVVVQGLDYAGPVQTVLRQWWPGFSGFSARHPLWVIATLSLVFYPYVYMLARLAFLTQGRAVMEQARLLGRGPWAAFFQVALPMARPAIAAGLALALMETLADFGAVSVFNFDTFTTAIYKSWYGLFNLAAAAQLASLLLLFVLLALWLERRGRGRARYGDRGGRPMVAVRSRWAWLMTCYAGLVVVLAFVLPAGRLLYWTLDDVARGLDARFMSLALRTLTLGISAGVLVVGLASVLAWLQRLRPHRLMRALVRTATMGYALPGSVLAVGIVIGFAAIDRQLGQWFGWRQLLVGSLGALFLAYVIRFMAVAFGPVESALERVRPALLEAARTLGAQPLEAARRVLLPMVAPGLITALLLVGIDIMKEMPATLLLRPFGWDTLAVRIYELTAEGEWQRAALPSLALVAVGLLPVYLLVRRLRHF